MLDPDAAEPELVLIHESAGAALHSPVHLGPRPRPPELSQRVDPVAADQPGQTGVFYCQNVRLTQNHTAGWEHVRAIRVLAGYGLTLRSSHSYLVHAGSEVVELGTVPLAPDGSFAIEVPANTAIALQAVDAEGRSELNQMSWMTVRPGETRGCVGCHQPRQSAPPPLSPGGVLQALSVPPLKLTGRGDPPRFRGNNAAVTGLMELQFDRFREVAGVNNLGRTSSPDATGRDEIEALIADLTSDRSRPPACRRPARRPGPRSAGGTRPNSLPARRPTARSGWPRRSPWRPAARVTRSPRSRRLWPIPTRWSRRLPPSPWKTCAALRWMDSIPSRPPPNGGWITAPNLREMKDGSNNGCWNSPETTATRPAARLSPWPIAAVPPAAAAIQEKFLTMRETNPFPAWRADHGHRGDGTRFNSLDAVNPRALQEVTRALAIGGDPVVPLLAETAAAHLNPETGNLFLAESAVEALARIGSPAAESALLGLLPALPPYFTHSRWYGDHDALIACHAAPVHARIVAALDKLGSRGAAPHIPALVRMVPTDPDRALLPANDDFETLVGRVIRRSGQGDALVNACLSLLGDPEAANPDSRVVEAISDVHAAWAGRPCKEIRAAQILSLVDPRSGARTPRACGVPTLPIPRKHHPASV